MTIYIVIPAHNEAHNIVSVVSDAHRLLNKTNFNFKIIIIDDGSVDGTTNLLNKLPFANSIEILHNSERYGLGLALAIGLEHAVNLSTDENDIVVVMEGDGTSDVSLLPKIISHIVKGKDIIIASRFLRESGLIGFSFSRKIFSYTVNRIFALLCKAPRVKDYTMLYRGYRVNVLKRAFFDYGDRLIIMKGFEGNTELLLKLMQYNINVSEIPLVYNYSLKKSRSKMNIIGTIFGYLLLLYKQKRIIK